MAGVGGQRDLLWLHLATHWLSNPTWAASALASVPRSTAHNCVTLGTLVNLACDLGYNNLGEPLFPHRYEYDDTYLAG